MNPLVFGWLVLVLAFAACAIPWLYVPTAEKRGAKREYERLAREVAAIQAKATPRYKPGDLVTPEAASAELLAIGKVCDLIIIARDATKVVSPFPGLITRCFFQDLPAGPRIPPHRDLERMRLYWQAIHGGLSNVVFNDAHLAKFSDAPIDLSVPTRGTSETRGIVGLGFRVGSDEPRGSSSA